MQSHFVWIQITVKNEQQEISTLHMVVDSHGERPLLPLFA